MTTSEDVIPSGDSTSMVEKNLFENKNDEKKRVKAHHRRESFKRCHSDSMLETIVDGGHMSERKKIKNLAIIEGSKIDNDDKKLKKFVGILPIDKKKARFENELNEKENIRRATASLSPMSSLQLKSGGSGNSAEKRDASPLTKFMETSPLGAGLVNLISSNSNHKSLESMSTDNVLLEVPMTAAVL